MIQTAQMMWSKYNWWFRVDLIDSIVKIPSNQQMGFTVDLSEVYPGLQLGQVVYFVDKSAKKQTKIYK